MSDTQPVKRTSRSRTTRRAAVDSPDHQSESVAVEKPMTEQDKSTENGGKTATSENQESSTEVKALSIKTEGGDAKSGAITVSSTGSTWARPIVPGEIEIVEQFTAAGLRPIAASHLNVYGTILNNRPIMASSIRVVETNALADHRPIFASELAIRDDLTLPGGRPVFSSDPRLLEATLLPGGRPVAPNDIDDAETLMGFID